MQIMSTKMTAMQDAIRYQRRTVSEERRTAFDYYSNHSTLAESGTRLCADDSRSGGEDREDEELHG